MQLREPHTMTIKESGNGMVPLPLEISLAAFGVKLADKKKAPVMRFTARWAGVLVRDPFSVWTWGAHQQVCLPRGAMRCDTEWPHSSPLPRLLLAR